MCVCVCWRGVTSVGRDYIIGQITRHVLVRVHMFRPMNT